MPITNNPSAPVKLEQSLSELEKELKKKPPQKKDLDVPIQQDEKISIENMRCLNSKEQTAFEKFIKIDGSENLLRRIRRNVNLMRDNYQEDKQTIIELVVLCGTPIVVAGAATGAAIGAGIGAMIGNGPGAVVGAIAGGIGGSVAGAGVATYIVVEVAVDIETYQCWEQSSLNKHVLPIYEKFIEESKEFQGLLCPITHSIPQVPVLSPYGHIYEKAAIEKWLTNHTSCPITRQPLNITDLYYSPVYTRKIIAAANTTIERLTKEETKLYVNQATTLMEKEAKSEITEKLKEKKSYLQRFNSYVFGCLIQNLYTRNVPKKEREKIEQQFKNLFLYVS